MSAIEALPARPAPLRLVRGARPDTPLRPGAYRHGERDRLGRASPVPTPHALRPYVRDDHHFALVLNHVADMTGLHRSCGGYPDALLPTARRCLQRAAASLNDPELPALLMALVPLAPCGRCGRPFLRETARREHCCDRCRRASWARSEKARAYDRARHAAERAARTAVADAR